MQQTQPARLSPTHAISCPRNALLGSAKYTSGHRYVTRQAYCSSPGRKRRNPRLRQQMLQATEGFFEDSGDVLLSQTVSHQVPSALRSLTSEFGMRSGGTSSLWSPETEILRSTGSPCGPPMATPDLVRSCSTHTHTPSGQPGQSLRCALARLSLVHGAGLRGSHRQSRSSARRCRHCALRRNREDEGCQYGDKPFDRLVLLGSLPYTCSLSTS